MKIPKNIWDVWYKNYSGDNVFYTSSSSRKHARIYANHLRKRDEKDVRIIKYEITTMRHN